MQVAQPYEQTVQATLNLGEIANVRSAAQVQICPEDGGEDPCQRTLSLERSKAVRARRKQNPRRRSQARRVRAER